MHRDGAVGRGGLVGNGALSPTVPAVTLLCLNVVDGLCTLAFVEMGVASEANPLMRAAYEISPLSFMAVKLVVVNTGVLVLAWQQAARLARLALNAAAVLYAVIVVWHLAFIAHLLTG
jgi:hypothetical protein